MKIKKILSAVFAFFICQTVPFFSEEFLAEPIAIENSGLPLSIFTLKNGMTVFVIPDKACALSRIEFVCKAGFSTQTPSTCGFYSLYAKLFPNLATEKESELFRNWNLNVECKADSTTMTCEIPSEEIELFFKSLNLCLSNPDFGDGKIKNELSKMKKESLDYSKTTAAFINSSIDARIFAEEPWKHDSGIYPSLFSDYSVAQTRTILSNIQKNSYRPSNCALFISGNIRADEISSLAQICFEEFSDSSTGKKNNSGIKKNPPEKKRKFVIVSDEFSKELTQIVVQYTSFSNIQSSLISAACRQNDSLLKTSMPQIDETAIRSRDYIESFSTYKNGHSRLIFQALMEKPYFFKQQNSSLPMTEENISIAEQGDIFVEMQKKFSKLGRKEFIEAQKLILDEFELKTGNSSSLSELLADFWPLCQWTSPDEFYSLFQNSAYEVQTENEKAICELMFKENPFVFLLVNSEIYSRQKVQFEEKGYSLIDSKNSSWWKDELLAKYAKAEKNRFLKEEKSGKTKIIGARPSEFFYANSARTMKESKLKNGIPIIVKENKGSRTVAVSISISGGILSSPPKEKNLRSILVSALAKNSKIHGITHKTKETVSFIDFEVKKDDFEKSIKEFTEGLIYGEITPVQADRLFAEENYNFMMSNADLGNQMKNNVLAYLYRSTDLGNFYRDYDNKNNSASYQSLLTGYTELLDASLYSLSICGDIEFDAAKKICEENLGLLKELKERKEITLPSPAWKNRERNIQLRHLYSSDLPPELAPKESPILVPTKEFLDPVQFYFSCEEKEIQIFNSLLHELSDRIQMETGNYCRVMEATQSMPIGFLQGNKVKKADAFLKTFRKHQKKLLEELEDSGKSRDTSRKITTRYEKLILEKTFTNMGTAELISDGIQEGKASKYLETYLELENASPERFARVLKSSIMQEPLMKVYSVDGKK